MFSVTLDVKAADYTTVGWGSTPWSSAWVYGPQVNLAGDNRHWEYNGSILTDDDATNLTWEVDMSVPLDISAIAGTNQITFEDNIKSVIWSLASSIEYGMSRDNSSLLYGYHDIGIQNLYLVINGQRYDVPFLSDGSYSPSDGSNYKKVFVDGYFPIDLTGLHAITKWDISLHANFLCSASTIDADLDYDTFSPWMRWNLRLSTGNYALSYLAFETPINVTGEAFQEQTEAIEQVHETSKGILSSVNDFFGSFFSNLIDSIVSIFVPDSETMKGLFDRLDEFFSDTFGFLYLPFDIFFEFVSLILDSSNTATQITFPGFSIMGHEVWPDIAYDINSNPIASTIFPRVKLVTSVILIGAMINYLRNFFDKRFGGGGN